MMQDVSLNVLSSKEWTYIAFCHQNRCECEINLGVYQNTFSTVTISISLFTSFVTVTSLFVTWRVFQTMTATVVDTAITIGTVNARFNSLYLLVYTHTALLITLYLCIIWFMLKTHELLQSWISYRKTKT